MNQKQVPKIKPSQRGKKRYILFELSASSAIPFGQALDAVLRAFHEKFSSEEFGKLRLKLIEFKICTGILRVAHSRADAARSVLNSIGEVSGRKVKAQTLSTSGSLKKLRSRIKE